MVLNCDVTESLRLSRARRSNQSILMEILDIHWRTEAEAEVPILWPPDWKNWLIGKGRDAWQDWRQEEKGMTGDEMVEWNHRHNGSMSLSKFWELMKDRETWHAAVSKVTKSWTWLSNWTTITDCTIFLKNLARSLGFYSRARNSLQKKRTIMTFKVIDYRCTYPLTRAKNLTT